MSGTPGGAIVSRRFAGPKADEIAILCRLDNEPAETIRQAEAIYQAFADFLESQQGSSLDIVGETLFLRDIERDLPLALDVRARILARHGDRASAPFPTVIQQAPLGGSADFELLAWIVLPRDRKSSSVLDVDAPSRCPCAACARSAARVVRLGDQTSAYTTNVYGVGGDAFTEALDMFLSAERLLEQGGFGMRDVVRTWIYLRDIDRDYDALNRARREAFRRFGLDLRPASTGVQGGPVPGVHGMSMSLHAVKGPQPIDVTCVSSSTLNEAWSYGADFSRALRVVEANKVALHVSGTASIDDAGRSVHAGDLEAQANRMFRNIEALLVGQGAGFEQLVAGVTYVKHASDAPALRSILRAQGFEGFPCALVEAPLCRPELLCETEAVALLPLAD